MTLGTTSNGWVARLARATRPGLAMLVAAVAAAALIVAIGLVAGSHHTAWPFDGEGRSKTSSTPPPRNASLGAARRSSLVIGAVGLVARVVPVQFDGNALGIPSDLGQVGMWSAGATLTDQLGNTVLVGHVSDSHDRHGEMAKLADVKIGDSVTVYDAQGHPYRFAVSRRSVFRKEALPVSVFAQSGPHELVLITCSHKVTAAGGGFHYTDNFVVEAQPIGALG